MKIKEIIALLDAKLVSGNQWMEEEVEFAFSSDLMSDVLTLRTNHVILLTGLCNIQTMRTVEMADIKMVLFVRGKKVTDEMLEIAEENDIILLECPYSMFKTSGLLYEAGLKPVY